MYYVCTRLRAQQGERGGEKGEERGLKGKGGEKRGGNGRTMAVLLRGVLDEAHAGPIHLV